MSPWIVTPRGFKTEDLIGKRFGRLKVVKFLALKISRADKHIVCVPYWECECDCGGVAISTSGNLKSGKSRSCDCLKREKASAAAAAAITKHGHARKSKKSRTYYAWRSMRARCYNKNDEGYPDYGGRGIKVCERWMNSFENFLTDMGAVPVGLSLHRVDNDLGYSPDNCIWATKDVQHRAMRSNVKLTYNGKTQCVMDWAGEVGLPWGLLYKRVKAGWDATRTLTTPPGQKPKPLTLNGKTQSRIDWANDLGISVHTIVSRIHMGWPVEKILTTPVNQHSKKLL